MVDSKWSDDDWTGPVGNRLLAAQITDFWAELGYQITCANDVFTTQTRRGHQAPCWGIRSNLVNGLPKGFRIKDFRKLIAAQNAVIWQRQTHRRKLSAREAEKRRLHSVELGASQ